MKRGVCPGGRFVGAERHTVDLNPDGTTVWHATIPGTTDPCPGVGQVGSVERPFWTDRHRK